MCIANDGKQEIAHQLRFAGMKNYEIAEVLVVSLSTLSKWMKTYVAELGVPVNGKYINSQPKQ